MALLGAAAVGYVAFLVIAFSSIPTVPPAPELEGVDLSPLGADANSEALDRLLGSSDFSPPVGTEAFEDAQGRIETGQWLADPDATLAALGDTEGATNTLAEAIREPGCISTPPIGARFSGESPPSYGLELVRGARVMAVATVAHAQRGTGAEVADDVASVLEGFHRLATRCANPLDLLIMLQIGASSAHVAAGYLIAAPELPPEAQELLARRLVEIEVAAADLSDSIRREWAQQIELLEMGEDTAELEQMRRMLRRSHARLLWLAEQPPGSDLLERPTPEEQYESQIRGRFSPLVNLRIGEGTNVGLMMAHGHLLRARQLIIKYHRERCSWALRRARWMEALRRRGRAIPDPWRATEPRNPFTEQAISSDAPESTVCRKSATPLSREEFAELPAPPPAAEGIPID